MMNYKWKIDVIDHINLILTPHPPTAILGIKMSYDLISLSDHAPEAVVKRMRRVGWQEREQEQGEGEQCGVGP